MLPSLYALGLLLTFALITSAKVASQKHHKVRHKHNSFGLRDNHVNEIRDAFDEYRHVLRTTKRQDKLMEYPEIPDIDQSDEYGDAIDKNSHKYNSWESSKLRGDATKHKQSVQTSFHKQQAIKLTPASSNEYFLRNKRVYITTKASTTQRTTTTLKPIDNYDEEYEDDNNDTTNRRLNDDAEVFGSMRFNRDSSDNQNQLAEGESLTDFKMKTLGTMDDVRNSFQKEMSSQQKNNVQDVHHHIRQNMLRTKIDGMCRWPNKKVIEMPQHASKKYTPQKYVVHRCSDDTACCGSVDKTCVAKRTEDLVLWFHVRFIDSTGVEPLKVKNHTECECIYKNRPAASYVTRLPYLWPTPATISTTTKAPSCKCPTHFDAEMEDGACGCICKDVKVECRQRFEGKEGFTMSDQRCIINNDCVQPHCHHGTYSSNSGRCPDKNEKINKGFQSSRVARRA